MVVSVVGGTSHDTNARATQESLFSMPLQPGVKRFAHATGLALQPSAHALVLRSFGLRSAVCSAWPGLSPP
jgi:hypothetical protein